MNSELTGAGTDVLLDALLGSPEMHVFLQRLESIAGAAFADGEHPAHCSVALWRKRRPLTIVRSDPDTAALDDVQYATNEGPCITAALTGQLAEVTDVRTETKWPGFTAAMAGSPVRSVLAVPIPLQTSSAAALNCYSPYLGHDLAAGVIMAQTGCDQKQAVNIMMRASHKRHHSHYALRSFITLRHTQNLWAASVAPDRTR